MTQHNSTDISRTREEFLNLIRAREVTSRSREVYKEEKKEIQKDPSRLECEDVKGVEVSARPASWPEAVASSLAASTPSSFPLAGTSCQEREVVGISPRELSSRYSGISVQHVRTPKGVKVNVTLQQPSWQAQGQCQEATAELKRYDRMREIKATADDSEAFAQYLEDAKSQLQDAKNRSACIGRLHRRGQRDNWLIDALAVALFDQDRMSSVILYLEGEEFVIDMTHDMSPNQEKYFHSNGIYGQLHSARPAPRLSDLPLVKFGEA